MMCVTNILTVLFPIIGMMLSKDITQNNTNNDSTTSLNFIISEYIVGIESVKPMKKVMLCSGTLITSTFVLSSAYCISRFSHNKVIAYQTKQINRTEYRQVISINVHSSYESAKRLGDVSILKLVKPFSQTNKFAKLYSSFPKSFENDAEMQCVVMGIGDAKSRGYRVPVRVKYGRSACQIPESMSSIKYIIADTWSNFLCSVSTSSFTFPCNRGDPLICRGRQLGITSYGYSTKTFVGAEETNCGNQDIQIRHLLIVDYVKWIVSTISNMTSDNATTTTTAKLSTITSVGKSTFNPNDFPYLVYLKGNAGEPVCGGSLISPIHVLTSAYCISRSTNITVHLSIEEDQISYGRPRVHPDYALHGMNANIGIIVLEVPFVVENYVKLAEFSKLSNNKKVISHFCVVIIKRPLKQHYFVPVNVKYGPKACRKPGKQETYLRNWDAYFCAQFDDKNFLNEEIGDPLICNGLQYGIASHHWLIPSGKDIKKEFHYMRVNNFKQWIDEVTMPLSSSGSILSVVSVCYIVLSRSILSIMESYIKKNYFK